MSTQSNDHVECAIDQAYKLSSLLRVLSLAVDGEQIAGTTFAFNGGGSIIDMAANMAGEIVENLELGQKNPRITTDVLSV